MNGMVDSIEKLPFDDQEELVTSFVVNDLWDRLNPNGRSKAAMTARTRVD